MDNFFLKKLLTLLTGTGLAQIVSLFFVYILTFFYSPLDYKSYGVFVGIITIIGGIVTLKYELAIPLEKDDQDASSLVYLTFLTTSIITFLISIIALPISFLFFKEYIIYVIIGVPTIFATGLYNIFFHWALRENAFKDIAITRVSQASVGGIVHSTLGLLGLVKYGLPIGNFFNFSSGLLRLLKIFNFDSRRPNWVLSKKNFFKHKKYLTYSTLESFFLTSSQHVPTIIIGILYGTKAGLFMLCSRVIAAPVGLIGENLKSLYLAEIATYERHSEIRELTNSIVNKTVIFGNIPIVILSVSGFFFADIFFPDRWGGVGHFMLLVSPWMNMSLLSRSFSVYYNYTSEQEINFYLTITVFICGLSVLLLTNKFKPEYAIEAFCIINFIIYLIYYLYSAWKLKVSCKTPYIIILTQVLSLLLVFNA